MSVCVLHIQYVCQCSCSTWEDVDVDDGERVRVYVDDDVHTEQHHAQLGSQLRHQSSHGLGAGRRQEGHLLVQLGGRREERTFTDRT